MEWLSYLFSNQISWTEGEKGSVISSVCFFGSIVWKVLNTQCAWTELKLKWTPLGEGSRNRNHHHYQKRWWIAVKWLSKASQMPIGSLRLGSIGTGVTEMLILARKKIKKKKSWKAQLSLLRSCEVFFCHVPCKQQSRS